MHSILLQKYLSKAGINYSLKKRSAIKTQKDTELSIFRTFCQNAYSQKCILRKVYKIKEVSDKLIYLNPAKRNVLDLKNETCKNREKRNVLKISHTRHFKTTKKQSKTGCFYSF